MRTYGYKCDRCGKEMEEPWSKVWTHADVYWASEPSVHLCKECAKAFHGWLKAGGDAVPAEEYLDRLIGIAEVMETNVECARGMCSFMEAVGNRFLSDGDLEHAKEWELKHEYEKGRLSKAEELRKAVKIRIEDGIDP